MSVMSIERSRIIRPDEPERVIRLPEDLAPSKRDALLALVADCGVVAGRPEHRAYDRTSPQRQDRDPCYVCHKATGPMGGHHVRPGDNTSVVPVHRACHRRLHAAGRDALDCGVVQPYPEEQSRG